MIVGVGIDIVENDRIRNIINRYDHRFLNRIYSPEEIEYCQSSVDFVVCFAARFAVKEAAIKALYPSSPHGISYSDITISGIRGASRSLSFKGRALERYQELNIQRHHVSLSHGRDSSVAVVILENSNTTPA